MDSFLVSLLTVSSDELETALALLDVVKLSEWSVLECVSVDEGMLVGVKLVEEVMFSTSVAVTSLRFKGVIQFRGFESSVVCRVVKLLCAVSVRPCGNAVTGSERRKTPICIKIKTKQAVQTVSLL